MATGLLNINPYYKGVNLDFTSKPTQLAIQLQQKEQAKAEALEKYYMDYEKSINPKGLGRGETDVFNKKYNAAREYWMKNKEAILHPTKYGMDAQSTYLAALKDAQGYIELGKQATAERKAFSDYIKKQVAEGKHISDNYLQVMENAMKPVEAGYVAPDLSQIKIWNPHDPLKFGQKLDLLLKRTEGVPTKEFLPGSKTEFQWATPKTINKEEAKSLAYSELQDDGYREYITNITKDPIFLKSLSEVYKKRTGQNLNVNDIREVSYANVLAQAPDIVDRIKPELTEAEQTRLALARQKGNGNVENTNPPHPSSLIQAVTEGNLNYAKPVEKIPNLFDATDDLIGYATKVDNGVKIRPEKIMYNKLNNKFIITYPEGEYASEELSPSAFKSIIMANNPDVSAVQKNWGAIQKPASNKGKDVITVLLEDQIIEIPSNNWDAFKKKYPKAKIK